MDRIGRQLKNGAGRDLRLWMAAGVAGLVALGLFFIVWKGQFAAPPSYLFGSASQGEEAALCLLVAQETTDAGAVGSYPDEAAQFWLRRLREEGVPMGGAITAARRIMAEGKRKAGGGDGIVWLREAMTACSNRAVMFGAHFRAFG